MKKYTAIIMLVIAVGLAVLAGWLGLTYLENREASIRSELARQKEPVQVVVAARDLYPGDPIDGSTMAIREIPREFVPSGAISVAQYDAVSGLRLKMPMKDGTALISAFIAGMQGVGSFSELLRPGERAITVDASPLDSAEGLLQAGDHIDLIRVSDQGQAFHMEKLLDNVTVLATGPRTMADMGFGGDGRAYSSITVGVPVEDVANMLRARSAGELGFLLRHPDDERTANYGQVRRAPGIGIEVLAGGEADQGQLNSGIYRIGNSERNYWSEQTAGQGRVYQMAADPWDTEAGSESNEK
ncbi:Flp pilus assembly protein CpaB [Alloalcanivorax gelatiniphagus]|uniref:Flp pilus assembly protein CpaB n=1 Tax=Alloalcanivorax gelatiniphagus TaxID=1194167 RepID=A0ABY2XHZ7_9GAMM|nr:Flp pilus assembly protein CpaB [Alloalcanivorax gelatiniphagus]TMW11369.1 Flp pilus assembly protein CpaB [Alloalcanivorax gelatiniphagus]|tara:strand:- start:42172 stop:43071 length:900 start_codon:yes stop_codon:yes gene_type:complete